MDYKIIWSPEALTDITDIGEFIEKDSSYYAESIVTKLYDTTQPLAKHPKLGRIVPEIENDSIRELFIFQYRIIYEIIRKEIHILAVIHGKRGPEVIERRIDSI